MDIYDQLLDSAQPPAAPQPLANPDQHNIYDDLLDQQQAETDQRLRKTLDLASQFNPEHAAQASTLAQRMALPVDVIERNLPEAQRRSQMTEVANLANSSPVLKKQLFNPEFAKIAHDDTPNLNALESVLKFGKDSYKTIGAGAFAGTAGLLGGVEAVNKNIGDLFDPVIPEGFNPWYIGADNLKELRHSQQDWSKYLTPEADTNLGKGLISGGMSLAQNIPMLAAAVYARNPNLALNAMAGITFGTTYGEDSDLGIDTATATAHGAINGWLEKATEGWSLNRLLGDLKAGSPMIKTLLHQAIPEFGGEQVATATQGLTDWLVQHPDRPLVDYLKTMPDAAEQTFWGSVLGGGVMAGSLKALDVVQNRFNVDLGKAKLAEQHAQNIEQLNQVMAASKVVKRSTDMVKSFVDSALETGVENFYINAQTFLQTGSAEQIAALLPKVAEQLAELPHDLISAHEITIPISDYAAHIAGTEYAQSLTDHLRLEGEDYTRDQAKTYLQSHAEELQQATEKALAGDPTADSFAASKGVVRGKILEQLNSLNRFTSKKNEYDATLATAWYGTQATKLGMTPEELHAKIPLNFAAENVAGQMVYGQKKPIANTVEFGDFKTGVPVSFDFAHNTESATKIFGKPKKDAPYGRGIEPSARYVTQVTDASKVDTSATMISGKLTFNNPLVLNTETWKQDLFDHYKKRGKALSKALIADGYDGVVTVSHDDRPGRTHTSEILDLTTFDESKALYQTDNTQPRLAPNGKPSNLNPMQWAQVRTAKFKEWFGDWEQSLQEPVQITEISGDEIQGATPSEARKNAVVFIDNLIKALSAETGKDTLHNQRTGYDIRLTKKGIVHGFQHQGPQNIKAVAAIKQLIENAVKIAENNHEPANDNFKNVITLVSPLKLAGQLYAVKLTVKESWDGKFKLYDHQALDMKMPDGISESTSDKSDSIHRPASGTEVSVEQMLVAFNGDNQKYIASKVVDENGEPLVVYHGTNKAFTTINMRKGAQGLFWVTSNKSDIENGEVGAQGSGKIMELFVSLKNPANWKQYDNLMTDEFKGRGLDGGLLPEKSGDFVAFILNPNQAKSALKNNGQFSTDDNNILHQQQFGSFNPETNTIAVFKQGNLSTVLHELGHFFFENNIFLAAELSGKTEQLTDGEQSLVNETSALLSWHGIQGTPQEQIEQWYTMDFEQKRGFHERTAESFEAYLFSGKAPSIELQSAFQTFKRWMLDVYKSITAFLAKHPEAGKLNPEVRAIFDRMLASEEEIKLAEQSRSMMPLFEQAGQDGMNEADFAAYQALGIEATNSAVDDLTARGLRDMQWLQNARTKSLKLMQKKHDALRREVRAQARFDILAQPVYQAWSFLTGKQEEGSSTGRLDLSALKDMDLPESVVNLLVNAKMTAKDGLHPDIVSDLFGFSSGDELVNALASADNPKAAIEKLTDQRMLEQHAELSTPEAVQRAADIAVHNDARARFVATEQNALAKATGSLRLLGNAAKDYATAMIGRLKIRDIKPVDYSRAEVKAARAALAASKKGDTVQAATEKRNQLLNLQAAKAAYAAQDDIAKILRYFLKFDGTKQNIDIEYLDQIRGLLDKFDLRKQSNTQLDENSRLRDWVQTQLAAGELPIISESLLNPQEQAAYLAAVSRRNEDGDLVYDDEEALKLLADAIDRSAKRSYKDASYDEFKGLHDTIKQIEHLGRLKNKLLTTQEQRNADAIFEEIAESIVFHGGEGGKNTRDPNDVLGKLLVKVKKFGAAHIKVATWARIMDGGFDNGPVWRYLVKPANQQASLETTMRAASTKELDVILRPILAKVSLRDLSGKGKYFASIGTSLNWQERFAFLLNMGNESNLQRLMGGGIAGVTGSLNMQQILEVVGTLSWDEVYAAQRIWDHFESLRPLIAEKEKRMTGVEPNWVPIRPIDIKTNDGRVISLRGGYFPVKFDTRANRMAEAHGNAQEAKDLMKASYSAAVTRRSFVKNRVEEVTGRPLLLNLTGLYSGVNDVIHDLAWHEWVVDANKILKKIDPTIREFYGAEINQQFTKWRDDIIVGQRKLDHGIENAAAFARQYVSASALTFNVMSAAMQPLGLANSAARIGIEWTGKGVGIYLSDVKQATRDALGKSEWLRNRTRTRFRELNELRNQVQGQTAGKELMGRYGYWLMMKSQMTVDIPTWHGGYEKAIAAGHNEDTAIALADQGVKDSQGGGEEVDQSGIERGTAMVKLFTSFYGFMGTTLNTAYSSTVTEKSKAKIAANLLLTLSVAPVLGYFLREALTPGGDDDDEDLASKLISEQLSFLFGLVAFGREFGGLVKDSHMGYSGPTGLRLIPDTFKLVDQAKQGEFDTAFRKQFVNVMGDLTGLPAVQINRSWTGIEALNDGETENPAAIAFGFRK